ncbi:hypothetical protein [Natronobacterium gregoryi]|uniref:Uncharacterized protein n=2 Tax=Natronobacterium gregoryi TaxID=44930 RepID=L0AEL6_NATGS|nr:hypothetical protein [Natronobacterium gregoryi]AFZ72271.1 hypothetical protein Natgr_1041 [Natronobacterium gregoryi SP2]PLK20220.1 hypothetical protein CYV19_11045 [Natronobacterium gregoryi SP2]SFJ29284.1 hypothetical protein SAMN05443661_12069 [Natronobacterium gregoryi]
MVDNPRKAYGALLVMIAAAISGVIIAAGFVAPEFIMDGNSFWFFLGAVAMMIVCALISWSVNLPYIITEEFTSNGGDE